MLMIGSIFAQFNSAESETDIATNLENLLIWNIMTTDATSRTIPAIKVIRL